MNDISDVNRKKLGCDMGFGHLKKNAAMEISTKSPVLIDIESSSNNEEGNPNLLYFISF